LRSIKGGSYMLKMQMCLTFKRCL